MVKTLRRIGNSYGVIIDRPIMDLLGINAKSQLEVTTRENGLFLRPIREAQDRKSRVRKSADRMARVHRKALKELADWILSSSTSTMSWKFMPVR
jgi:antitoxin MazE